MSRFVRASKFRHVFGTPAKRGDQTYDNMRVSSSAWDTNLVKVNPKFMSVNIEAGGGGSFTVINLDNQGRQPDALPVFNGHTSAVLDTDFNPFNDHIVASVSEDCRALVWKIPEEGLKESCNTPVVALTGHGRKVGHAMFHPTAENCLVTTSADLTVRLWDISKGVERQCITAHSDLIQSVTANWNGSLLATTCKDKKIRILDPRTGKVAHELPGHQGVKGSRIVWMGDSNNFITTGFSRTSDRQMFAWDLSNPFEPIKQVNVDTSSGMLMPFTDPDTSMVYLAGKGDGNIRYYEFVNDSEVFHYLSEHKSSEPQRGMAFLPKRACNLNEVEIARAYKVHVNMVEPISFKVPRKSDGFQSDLYPETVGDSTDLTVDDFFNGKDAKPKMIDLSKGFVASAPKEFVTEAVVEEEKVPQNEKEFQEGYFSLKKEVEQLKKDVAGKDVKIRQLELQLEQLKTN